MYSDRKLENASRKETQKVKKRKGDKDEIQIRGIKKKIRRID